MDYFDLQSISKIINRDKLKFIKELDAIDYKKGFNQNTYDLLTENLDYSPKFSHDGFGIKQPPQRIKLKNISNPPKSKKEETAKIVVKSVIDHIFTKVFEKMEIHSKIVEDSDSEESDDEYERMVALRRSEINQRMTNTQQGRDSNNTTDTRQSDLRVSRPTTSSKLWNTFKDANIICVYLFDSKKHINVSISANDTVRDLIIYTLQEIKRNPIVTLKYDDPNGFDITLADEDEGLPNMDFGCLDPTLNLGHAKNKFLAIIYKKNFTPDPNQFAQSTVLGETRGETNKLNIKVHFKIKSSEHNYKTVSLNGNQTLTSIIQYLFSKDYLKYKNLELYYFLYHSDDIRSVEPENSLSNDTLIKDLEKFELDIFLNKFSDLPVEINEGEESYKTKEIEEKNGGEFIFNEISAGKLQEFEVIKINKFQNRQERILGIDMYNIYNAFPNRNNKGFVEKLFMKKKIKTPQRKIKDIVECEYAGDKRFYYLAQDENSKKDEIKRVTFEVKNNNVRNEIVAKLKFLIKLNHES